LEPTRTIGDKWIKDEKINLESNGSEVHLSIRGHHLELENGISYYLLVFGDISDRKRSVIAMKKKMEDFQITEPMTEHIFSR